MRSLAQKNVVLEFPYETLTSMNKSTYPTVQSLFILKEEIE